jgi:hypothetical protein
MNKVIQRASYIKRRMRDTYNYWRVLSHPESEGRYKVTRVTRDNGEDLLAAKKLHASVYLSKSFILPEEVVDGIIHEHSDPHQLHAEYFVVKKRNEVVGVARQITYKGEGYHHESFPILEKSHIYDRSKQKILNYHPREIVEISALVKKGGESSIIPLLLYRALWRHSRHSQHRLWVMACDVRLYERLKVLFGPNLRRIGQRTPYRGGDVIPVALSIAEAVRYVIKMKYSRSLGITGIIQQRAAKFIVEPAKNV